MEVPNWSNKTGINLFCCDNLELMAKYDDGYFDLAIVDPPYGIGFSDYVRGGSKLIQNRFVKNGKKKWDYSTPSKEYFDEILRVSKNQIIWGYNYFSHMLPPTNSFICWNKHQNGHFSQCELAWTSTGKGKILDRPYQKDIGNKIHPTQKPIYLYDWCLRNYSKPGDKIIDTNLGSGNIAIACNYFGVELTGCDNDGDIFESAIKNISENTRQKRIFDLPQNIIIQKGIFDE